MMNSQNEHDLKQVDKAMFPRLADIRRRLLSEYYEADFIGDEEKAVELKREIEYIETAISLGEEYQVPF
jgi:hypothetical protein